MTRITTIVVPAATGRTDEPAPKIEWNNAAMHKLMCKRVLITQLPDEDVDSVDDVYVVDGI